LQTDDLPAAGGGLSDSLDRFVHIGLLVWRAAHLHQGQFDYS
jgi:hypothetical protein